MKKLYWLLLSLLFVLSCKSEGKNVHGDFPVNVVTAEIKTESLAETLKIAGSLLADEQVEIQGKTEGVLQKILVNEGQEVKEGDLLFVVEQTKYQGAFSQAEANFKLAQQNYERSQELIKQKSISQQEFDQSKSNYQSSKGALDVSKQDLADTLLYSPFSGFLGPRKISLGQMLTKGENITYLTKTNPLKIEFSLPENYSASLRNVSDFDLKVTAFPEETFKGKIYFVAPVVDEKTRTMIIKGSVNNQDGKLKPGMFAEVSLKLESTPGIFVPESALIIKGQEKFIYVVGENNTAEMRAVNTKRRFAGKVEIISDLGNANKVIVEGTQKLRPGSKLSPSLNN